MSLDPTIGRWITEDPIGFQAADANLYRYVGNNATNATDPTGHQANPIAGKDAAKHLQFAVGGGLWSRSAPRHCGSWRNCPTVDDEGIPGYFSRIKVNGDASANNCCNTPFLFIDNNFDKHGGAIALQLKKLTPGHYDVKVEIKVKCEVQLAKPKLPVVIVYKSNSDRTTGRVQLWTPKWKLTKGANY
jgi:hypothetical protein